MLGGIPVDYYYAVDMNAVKGLVDAIGGVQNFDVEMDFMMQGRSYTKGMQGMNGQAVLDYLRVRKGIEEAGDLNRINRQKKMLLAIFDKIKENALLTSIPQLLDAFEGSLYTNTSLAQTTALTALAYDVDPASIGMYSMDGHYANIFNWNFMITDQAKRVELIKQIYGVELPQCEEYTANAASTRWENMRACVIQKQADIALTQVRAILDADALLPVYVLPKPKPGAVTPDGYRQYMLDDPIWELYFKAVNESETLLGKTTWEEQQAANALLQNDVEVLCDKLGMTLDKYRWRVNYEEETNEVQVNFN